MSKITEADILEGIPPKVSNTPIPDEQLAALASKIRNWEEITPFLGLTEPEEEAISSDYWGKYELQKREMLRKWKEKNGQGATYCRLIKIICGLGKITLAEEVKETMLAQSNDQTQRKLEQYQIYLQDCYKHLPLQSSMLWQPYPGQEQHEVYIPLQFTDVSALRQQSSATPKQAKKTVPLSRVFEVGPKHQTRKMVLVEGAAGCGKTMALIHGCREWAKGNLFRQFDLLIYVPLQHPSIHSATSLAGLIPIQEKKQAIASYIAKQGGKGTCFLFDTWDEVPPQFQQKKAFLHDFITGTLGQSLPHCSILVASRTEEAGALYPSATSIFEVNRFTSSQVGKYIHSTVGHFSGKQAARELLSTISGNPEVASLCDLPLNDVILTFLFHSFKMSLPKTRTELFKCFVLTLLRRHLDEKTSHNIRALPSFDRLPEDTSKQLQLLCTLSYNGILKSKTTFSFQDLEKAEIPSENDTLGLMQANQYVAWFGLDPVYSFLHYAVQEFLCAFYISHLLPKEQVKAVQKILRKNPLSLVLPFHAGLTHLTEPGVVKVLMQVTTQPLDMQSSLEQLVKSPTVSTDRRRLLLALINCIHEAQYPSLCSQVSPPPNELLDLDYAFFLSFYRLHLDLGDCAAIGYFMANLYNTTYQIDLSYCNIGDQGVKLLLEPIMKKTQPALSARESIASTTYTRPKIRANLQLVLMENKFTVYGTKAISKALSSTTCITELNLNGIWDASTDIERALKYLLEGLMRNHSCYYLSLWENHLAAKHIHYIVLMVAFCSDIVKFEFGLNTICNTTCSTSLLGSAMQCARKFKKELALLDCGMGNEELVALGESLSHNRTVKQLAILCKQFSFEAFLKFLDLLTYSSIEEVTTEKLAYLVHCVLAPLLEDINRKRRGKGTRPLRLENIEDTMFYGLEQRRQTTMAANELPQELLTSKRYSE